MRLTQRGGSTAQIIERPDRPVQADTSLDESALAIERIGFSKCEKKNYFEDDLLSMRVDDEGLSPFLESFGFTIDELRDVRDELDAYRSLPGTTLRRYMNRVIDSILDEERFAFLKGILVGVAIRKAADFWEEPDLTSEEKRIACEIERLGLDGKMPKND